MHVDVLFLNTKVVFCSFYDLKYAALLPKKRNVRIAHFCQAQMQCICTFHIFRSVFLQTLYYIQWHTKDLTFMFRGDAVTSWRHGCQVWHFQMTLYDLEVDVCVMYELNECPGNEALFLFYTQYEVKRPDKSLQRILGPTNTQFEVGASLSGKP